MRRYLADALGRRSCRPLLAFLALYVPVLLAQVHAFWVERSGVASNPPDGLGRTTPEIAGAVTAAQTFRVDSPGLHAVIVHPRPVSEVTSGQVVLELEELRDGTAVSLVRIAPPASEVARSRRYVFSFPAIARPSGREFRLSVSLPVTPPGEGLVLLMVRQDRYRQGVLTVDGREQWGDLAFDTRATGETLVGRTAQWLSAYPSWVRSGWFLSAVFMWVNIWLAWAVWFAVRDVGLAQLALPGPQQDAVSMVPSAGSPARGWGGARLAVAGGLALVAVLAWTWWPRGTVIDLVDEFPDAVKRTTAPRLHDGFMMQDLTIEGWRRRCILALPPSRITWPVTVPAGGRLEGWAGMRPDTWTGVSDGALMRVGLSDGTVYEEPFRRYFNPVAVESDRTFARFTIDLSPHAGRSVEVIFNTGPGEIGNAVGDAAMWCAPRVVGS